MIDVRDDGEVPDVGGVHGVILYSSSRWGVGSRLRADSF
jgi:hypothetical protein